MTKDQEQALATVEAMIGEVAGGLRIASHRAESTVPGDPDLCDMLRGLYRIANLAGHEMDIATGASHRG